jgi:caffeoyl-CoA O-methyltransferase
MRRSASDYVRALYGPRADLLDEILRTALLDLGLRPMQVDDNAARVLQLLTHLHRPMRVIEIGTYFGYSTIHLARGLPDGGRLTTLELDGELAALAQENLERAGVAGRVEVLTGDAVEYLKSMQPKSVDMVFIDADKKAYPTYLKLCYGLVKSGGLILADDAFAEGDYGPETLPDAEDGEAVRAINTYNRAVLNSDKVLSAFIGTDNGLIATYKL